MKTEPELKSLAEFGVSFLRSASYYMNYDGAEDKLLNNPESASYLAHLALKEMEKRLDDVWECDSWISKNRRVYEYTFSNDGEEYKGWDENNFIALWSAIEQSGEKGE